MSEPLDDAFAKLYRAGEHLEELRDEVASFVKDRPYSVTGNGDLNTGEYVLRIKPKEPPKRISVLIGDVISNLRPPLDFLINALAVLDSGNSHPSNQFPICDTPAAFKGEIAKGRLAGLSASHKTHIEKLQPYPRRKGKVWLRNLRDLSNPDKHRHLNVLLAGIEADFRQPTETTPTLKQTFPPLRLKPITSEPLMLSSQVNQPLSLAQPSETVKWDITSQQFVLGPAFSKPETFILGDEPAWTIAQPQVTAVSETQQPSPKRDVQVEVSVAAHVALPDGTPVVEAMEILESQVAQVLNAFEREF